MESKAQPCHCHVCLLGFTPEVCISMNLCPLPGRLSLLMWFSVSSKKVTCERLPELKFSWVLLNGRVGDSSWCLCSSGCIVLLFLDWTWELMGWACQTKEIKTDYRISKAYSFSNCTLSYADRSSHVNERLTHLFNNHSGCLKYWLLAKM